MVACNTASAFSLDHLREHYGEKFPIIGLVPALKPAVLQTQSKSVAVLATPATFRGKLIKDVIKNFAEPLGVNVSTVTCLDLVPLVESGQQNSQQSHLLLQQLLDPIVDHGVDFLVLGCTHYPFLKDAIQHVYGDKLSLVDSGFAVARQTSRILIKNDLVSNQFEIDQPRLACFVSGQNAKELKPIIKCLIDSEISWTVENIVEKFN